MKKLVTSKGDPAVKRGISGACPRCKMGNMYKEMNDEYVCIQCGHRVYSTSNLESDIIAFYKKIR